MTCMGGGKGKKDEQLIFQKHAWIRNSTASFAKSTIIDTKQTITDAEPAVLHWINARWRA